MAHIVTHIAFPSMKSLPSLYPVVLNIEGRRHLVYLLRTRISSYIDCLMTFGLSPFQMFSFFCLDNLHFFLFCTLPRAKPNFDHEFVCCMVHSEVKSS